MALKEENQHRPGGGVSVACSVAAMAACRVSLSARAEHHGPSPYLIEIISPWREMWRPVARVLYWYLIEEKIYCRSKRHAILRQKKWREKIAQAAYLER